MIEYHYQQGGVATLMVKRRSTSRYFLFDKSMRLSGWENISTGERMITRQEINLEPFAFSGIHIINQDIISELGPQRKFSITNGYLDLSAKFPIFGWENWHEFWFDVGTPEKLDIVNAYFQK